MSQPTETPSRAVGDALPAITTRLEESHSPTSNPQKGGEPTRLDRVLITALHVIGSALMYGMLLVALLALMTFVGFAAYTWEPILDVALTCGVLMVAGVGFRAWSRSLQRKQDRRVAVQTLSTAVEKVQSGSRTIVGFTISEAAAFDLWLRGEITSDQLDMLIAKSRILEAGKSIKTTTEEASL